MSIVTVNRNIQLLRRTGAMDLRNVCIFTEPQQGATYEQLARLAQHAERLGFGGFFRSDHYRRLRNTLRYLLGALDGFSAAERLDDLSQMPELERWVLQIGRAHV